MTTPSTGDERLLRVAVPNKGALSQSAQEILRESGYRQRHDAKELIDSFVKDKEIGEDDGTRAQKEIEDLIQKGVGEVDQIVSRKERDILEV